MANQHKPSSQQFEAIEDKQARELTKSHINDIRNDLQILRRSVEFNQKDKGCPPPPEVKIQNDKRKKKDFPWGKQKKQT